MQFSTVLLSFASVAFGQSGFDPVLAGYEGALVNYRQAQDALNSHLGPNLTQFDISTYVGGASTQIENAISAVSNAAAPYTGDIAIAVSNYLLSGFYDSVTNGAETIATLDIDSNSAAQLVGDYSRLIKLGQASNITTSQLEDLSAKISPSSASNKKRFFSFGWEFFVSGSVQFQSSIGSAIDNLVTDDVNALLSQILSFVQAIEQHVSQIHSALSGILQEFTFGLINIIAGIVFQPIYQAIVVCGQILVNKIINITINLEVFNALQNLISTYTLIIQLGQSCGIDTSALQTIISDLQQLKCSCQQ